MSVDLASGALEYELTTDIIHFSDGGLNPFRLANEELRRFLERTVETAPELWGDRLEEVAEKYAPALWERWHREDAASALAGRRTIERWFGKASAFQQVRTSVCPMTATIITRPFGGGASSTMARSIPRQSGPPRWPGGPRATRGEISGSGYRMRPPGSAPNAYAPKSASIVQVKMAVANPARSRT